MRKIVTKSLAKQTFDLLNIFISKADCGKWCEYFDNQGNWHSNPQPMITKELRHKFIHTPKNHREYDQIRRWYYGGFLTVKKMHEHQNSTCKQDQGYYTSKNKNWCMPMWDFDCHHEEQDLQQAMAFVKKFVWKDVYENDSYNGGHQYPIFKHSNCVITNGIFKKAKQVICDLFDLHGFQTEFEIKGNCTQPDPNGTYLTKAGSLATIPFVRCESDLHELEQLKNKAVDIKEFDYKIRLIEKEVLLPHQKTIAANRAIRKARRMLTSKALNISHLLKRKMSLNLN